MAVVAGRSTQLSDGRLMMSQTVYVRVWRNKFTVRAIESGAQIDVAPATPFTTQRLLVGHFTNTESALRDALRQATGPGWFKPSPEVLMHPLEMVEGGLSEIEDRIFRELAIGAGARRVAVWVGPELSDAEVKDKLNAKQAV
jgi:hypothetical protein